MTLAHAVTAAAALLVLAGLAAPAAEKPILRFGLVADAQYADKPAVGQRRYAEAANKLQAALTDLDARKLDFIANLGDVVDGNGDRTPADLERIAGLFRAVRTPVRHVVGNHCLVAGRPALVRALRLRSSTYEFRVRGWRFVVLDGMAVSTFSQPGSEEARLARDYLARDPSLPTYNGALGSKQLAWLEGRLADASRAGERVIVLCHHPVLETASTRAHLLWDHEEVLQALEQSGCVAAFICGHDHAGGYAYRSGIHHLTMPGLVEAPEGGNSFAVVDVFGDRLVVHGTGTAPSRELALRAGDAVTR